MTGLLRIVEAEAVLPGILKITWNDGFAGIVDLRALIPKGEMYAPLRDAAHFRRVKVEAYGHSIYWGEEGNEDVDFGCDRLREIAEHQARLLAEAM